MIIQLVYQNITFEIGCMIDMEFYIFDKKSSISLHTIDRGFLGGLAIWIIATEYNLLNL